MKWKSLQNNKITLDVNLNTNQALKTEVENQYQEWENTLKQTQFIPTTTTQANTETTSWTKKIFKLNQQLMIVNNPLILKHFILLNLLNTLNL